MAEQRVVIKGNKDGLWVTLKPDDPWQNVTGDLAARLDQQSAFFAGARITLDVGTRPLRRDELSSVKALLERRGMELWTVATESETTMESANALDLRTHFVANEEEAVAVDTYTINPEEEGVAGVMIRRTLRSGRTVHSSGHIVVFGDVNPGAELVAAGDVIVWGRLRGNVHAGAQGDRSAVVCALDMTPTQLRIADYITVSPADKRRKPRPETALIQNGQIIVKAWE